MRFLKLGNKLQRTSTNLATALTQVAWSSTANVSKITVTVEVVVDAVVATTRSSTSKNAFRQRSRFLCVTLSPSDQSWVRKITRRQTCWPRASKSWRTSTRSRLRPTGISKGATAASLAAGKSTASASNRVCSALTYASVMAAKTAKDMTIRVNLVKRVLREMR